MSAEAIAKVVRDFKRGNITLRRDTTYAAQRTVIETVSATIDKAQIVDITAVYKEFMEGEAGYALYEDTVCRPPWWYFVMAFENTHGNVHLMASVAIDRDTDYKDGAGSPYASNFNDFSQLSWDTDNITDWSQVRWLIWTSFWVGGRAEKGLTAIPTIGPFFNVYIAVDDDGHPLDVHWVAESYEIKPMHFESALAVMLKALTILNCRNVEVMEPVNRPKPERKRLERTGVTVTEIHVTKIGKYRRSNGAPRRLGEGVPLSTVRGHVARYGEAYGRGKLFGKYEGEFWIPGHLRGSAEVGATAHEYTVG